MRTLFARSFPVFLAVFLVGAAEAHAQTATVVTQSGQRFRGQVVSMGDTYGNYGNSGSAVVVRANGRDRRIPVEDVTFIDFTGNGNVPQNEMARANESYDGLVILRDGRAVSGQVVDLQNNRAVISTQSGDRTIPLNQVARVYFSGNNIASNEYGGYDNRRRSGTDPYYGQDPSGNYGGYRRNDQYDGQYDQYPNSNGAMRRITIPSNQAWTNGGIDVRRGDVIHFRASGNVSLSHNPGDYGTPAGANDGRLAGNSPLPGVTGGLLIGRVGNSRPFAIGAESDITMPANGRLYLGVNDDDVGDNSGNFVVEITPQY